MAEPRAVERHIRTLKTARYHLWGEASQATREIWIACHGYGQLAAAFARELAPLAASDRVVCAPEALHRFYLDSIETPVPDRRIGATWMTREERLHDIADNTEYLDAVTSELRAHAPSARVVALGFSQGAATVTRWAVVTAIPIARLVLWGSGLPPDLDWARAEPRLRAIRLTLVAGERDRYMTPERLRAERAELENRGVACESVPFAGKHALDAATLRRVASE